MYSIKAYYLDATHTQSNSPMPITGIVTAKSILLDKLSLVATVNKIFDGKHRAVFGKSELNLGYPESILLTTKNVIEPLR